MRQVLIIHGGTSFNSYESYVRGLKESPLQYERMKYIPGWREWLSTAMPNADILLPKFPNAQNAQYEEWKIQFEKILPFLTGDVSLVGYSLGAMFLAQYLHQTTLETPVSQIILIAPTYDDESGEELGSFKVTSATGLEKSGSEVHIIHSEDDPVSPFTELAKFTRDIPTAKVHVFTDRNHFFQPTFPELVNILERK